LHRRSSLTRSFLWALLAALALTLTLSACGPDVVDPLAVATPFTFEVDNPEEIEGPVYGAMIMPFEGDLPFGMGISPKMAPPQNLDALLNAIEDGELDEDGLVTGSFIPAYEVPRFNELLGIEFGWWVFLPPAGCDVTATNAAEAAIAPILGMALWDGETVDEGGYPVVDGIIVTATYTFEEDPDTETDTYEYYVPVVSRAAWSATTNGACEPEDSWLDSFDIDLQIAAGWQFLHVVQIEVCTLGDFGWDCSYSYQARSMTLEQIAAAGSIGEVVQPDMMTRSSTDASFEALAPIFR